MGRPAKGGNPEQRVVGGAQGCSHGWGSSMGGSAADHWRNQAATLAPKRSSAAARWLQPGQGNIRPNVATWIAAARAVPHFDQVGGSSAGGRGGGGSWPSVAGSRGSAHSLSRQLQQPQIVGRVRLAGIRTDVWRQ